MSKTAEEKRQEELRILLDYQDKKVSLYEVLRNWLHSEDPVPERVSHLVRQAFENYLSGRGKDLAASFGIQPPPGQHIASHWREFEYSGKVYWRVKYLTQSSLPGEKPRAIDAGLFEQIAEELESELSERWPGKKPPGGSTIKEWYLTELRLREPELAAQRNKLKDVKSKKDFEF